MEGNDLHLTLEFGGGAELLFNNKKEQDIKLSGSKQWTIRDLLVWMKGNLVGERPDFFFQGDSVRPGILVLVNETDWELLNELDYKLLDKDRVMFISTLHGGNLQQIGLGRQICDEVIAIICHPECPKLTNIWRKVDCFNGKRNDSNGRTFRFQVSQTQIILAEYNVPKSFNGLAHLSIYKEVHVAPEEVLDIMAKKPRRIYLVLL